MTQNHQTRQAANELSQRILRSGTAQRNTHDAVQTRIPTSCSERHGTRLTPAPGYDHLRHAAADEPLASPAAGSSSTGSCPQPRTAVTVGLAVTASRTSRHA